jgi:hypothetical protein
MAIQTERRPEVVEVERPVATRSQPRLHEEILPPELDPTTPIADRNARRALAVLAIGVALLQLVSAPIGHQLNSVARSGTDVYSVWQHYASSPVPDVLVIGASPARTDVDEVVLAAQLSSAVGRPITVGKMGFAGQTPRFLDALMYRVMKRPEHPKLIALVTVGPELNEGCAICIYSTNGGLWDITDFTDPELLRLSLQLSPNPGWLVAGWVVPTFAYYPSLIGLQCIAFDAGRSLSTRLVGRVPIQLQNTTACEATAAYKWGRQAEMMQEDYRGSLINYKGFMAEYRLSPATVASLGSIVNRARSGGSHVVFLETPLHPGLRTYFPDEVRKSQEQLHIVAQDLNADVIDLTNLVPDDPGLWVDGLHLDKAGADYFAPQLAQALAPSLPAP